MFHLVWRSYLPIHYSTSNQVEQMAYESIADSAIFYSSWLNFLKSTIESQVRKFNSKASNCYFEMITKLYH